MGFKIITDSTSDITLDKAQDLDIEILPLTVSFGDNDYRDGVDIDSAKFYTMLAASSALPVTSQVNPAAFLDAYERAGESGEDILVITLASDISGTYQSACIAAEQYSATKVYIVDSGSATSGQASLIMVAIKMRKEGKNIAEIFEYLEKIKQNLIIYACIDTLTYLQKGGRLSATGAIVGGLLNIKPIITVCRGKLEVVHKARGFKAACRWLEETVSAAGIDTGLPVGFVHASNPEAVAEVETNMKNLVDIPYSITEELGAVLGTHIGPNAVGISIYTKEQA